MSKSKPVLLDSPQPLYIQIRDALKQQILDGTYVAHQKLASENELMSLFGVSRITVRQALRELHKEGLVFSAQGKGSFVSRPKATQSLQTLEGFEEAMMAAGFAASTRMIGVSRRLPPQAVQVALRLGPSEEVLEVKRVRYVNQSPVSVDLSYFPMSVGERLVGRDLARDIFPMLENELAIALGVADIRIGAALADDDTARLLRIEQDAAVLRVERLTFDTEDRPVDFEYLMIRGDTYQYQFRVQHRSRKERR
jgi:GntR family transcriptional regulator